MKRAHYRVFVVFFFNELKMKVERKEGEPTSAFFKGASWGRC